MVGDFRDMAVRHAHREIAAALLDLEAGRRVYDFARLADDPAEELGFVGEVEVHFDTVTPGDCGVSGYYRYDGPRGPQIVVHPSSTSKRDNFTILHEFAHHLQRTHLAWADVWVAMGEREARLLNEDIADAVAAEILLPGDKATFSAADVTATELAQAHLAQPSASRSAVAYRALRDAQPADDLAIVVLDLDGCVVFARSVGTVMSPRRGAVQEGLAALVTQAIEGSGRVSGTLHPGLEAASGYVQDGLAASLALDANGDYAFAVVRPLHRYVAPDWSKEQRECSNPACGHVFETDEQTRWCRRCQAPLCPECGTCSCEARLTVCSACGMTLSNAEQADPARHECW